MDPFAHNQPAASSTAAPGGLLGTLALNHAINQANSAGLIPGKPMFAGDMSPLEAMRNENLRRQQQMVDQMTAQMQANSLADAMAGGVSAAGRTVSPEMYQSYQNFSQAVMPVAAPWMSRFEGGRRILDYLDGGVSSNALGMSLTNIGRYIQNPITKELGLSNQMTANIAATLGDEINDYQRDSRGGIIGPRRSYGMNSDDMGFTLAMMQRRGQLPSSTLMMDLAEDRRMQTLLESSSPEVQDEISSIGMNLTAAEQFVYADDPESLQVRRNESTGSLLREMSEKFGGDLTGEIEKIEDSEQARRRMQTYMLKKKLGRAEQVEQIRDNLNNFVPSESRAIDIENMQDKVAVQESAEGIQSTFRNFLQLPATVSKKLGEWSGVSTLTEFGEMQEKAIDLAGFVTGVSDAADIGIGVGSTVSQSLVGRRSLDTTPITEVSEERRKQALIEVLALAGGDQMVDHDNDNEGWKRLLEARKAISSGDMEAYAATGVDKVQSIELFQLADAIGLEPENVQRFLEANDFDANKVRESLIGNNSQLAEVAKDPFGAGLNELSKKVLDTKVEESDLETTVAKDFTRRLRDAATSQAETIAAMRELMGPEGVNASAQEVYAAMDGFFGGSQAQMNSTDATRLIRRFEAVKQSTGITVAELSQYQQISRGIAQQQGFASADYAATYLTAGTMANRAVYERTGIDTDMFNSYGSKSMQQLQMEDMSSLAASIQSDEGQEVAAAIRLMESPNFKPTQKQLDNNPLLQALMNASTGNLSQEDSRLLFAAQKDGTFEPQFVEAMGGDLTASTFQREKRNRMANEARVFDDAGYLREGMGAFSRVGHRDRMEHYIEQSAALVLSDQGTEGYQGMSEEFGAMYRNLMEDSTAAPILLGMTADGKGLASAAQLFRNDLNEKVEKGTDTENTRRLLDMSDKELQSFVQQTSNTYQELTKSKLSQDTLRYSGAIDDRIRTELIYEEYTAFEPINYKGLDTNVLNNLSEGNYVIEGGEIIDPVTKIVLAQSGLIPDSENAKYTLDYMGRMASKIDPDSLRGREISNFADIIKSNRQQIMSRELNSASEAGKLAEVTTDQGKNRTAQGYESLKDMQETFFKSLQGAPISMEFPNLTANIGGFDIRGLLATITGAGGKPSLDAIPNTQ